VHLILTNVACSLNLPMGWFMVAGCYCIMVPWILAHWEEYHTGKAAQQAVAGFFSGLLLPFALCGIVAGVVETY
jgi:hypothetical protein